MATIKSGAADLLVALNFGLVADLRFPSERVANPSPWPHHWMPRVLVHHRQTSDAPHHRVFAAAAMGADAVDRAYIDIYSSLPFDATYRALFADVLRCAALGEGRLLIHCSAGKDRTGILAALLLEILGVSRSEIFADYLRSAGAPELVILKSDILTRAERSGHALSEVAVETMLSVKPSYLFAAFKSMESVSGGINAYLEGGGVDVSIRDKLCQRFLDQCSQIRC